MGDDKVEYAILARMTQGIFVPARDRGFYLLQAHRQPLAENIAAAFIERFTQPADLVVDPFIASDAIVRAALGRGRRIVAADSNPLVAWAARVEATMPDARQVNGALLRLRDTRKEGETLYATIQKMYVSVCAVCGAAVTVDYVINRRVGDKILPMEKVYTCAECGTRRADATEADRQRALDAAPRGLHYHVLVQRLLADDAKNAALVKRLLGLYTPRNLNALALVTQKLDVEFREDPARNVLAALLLHALDIGTALYSSPESMPTREIPSEFVEVNIWRALEMAARGLSERASALRLAANPEQVVSGTTPAAFVGQGGARYLAEILSKAAPAALILSSPARLDPTFWEWSFLWARWLLGKNAGASLQPLLDEKNQRWGWYGGALTNAFGDIAKFAQSGACCVAAFPSGSHAMIEALMLAASPAFALEEFTFRPHRGATDATEWGALRGDYQVVWRRSEIREEGADAGSLAQEKVLKLRKDSLDAARTMLDARGEPLAYSWLHHAALDRLARDGVLRELLKARYKQGDNAFQFLRHRMEEGFKEGYVDDLDHWEEKGRVLWMRRGQVAGSESDTITGQVERMAREILSERKRIGYEQFEDLMLQRFDGLMTPEIELVEICARAYADMAAAAWVWRAENMEGWRTHAATILSQLGERLDFQTVEGESKGVDFIWRIEKIIPGSASGLVRQERIVEDVYAFVLQARTELEALMELQVAPLHGLAVIPESQVGLARERLRREPRWEKRLERAGWAFLRVPMMESLLREDVTTRPEFRLIWGLDPAHSGGQEQMGLFGL